MISPYISFYTPGVRLFRNIDFTAKLLWIGVPVLITVALNLTLLLQATPEGQLTGVLFKAALPSLLLLAIGLYLTICLHKNVVGGYFIVGKHLNNITSGNLTHAIRPLGSDESARLMNELKITQESLIKMVHTIRCTSDQLVTTSSEIATGAKDLSQRTEQTAANLEKSASSMEEISSTVKHTADNTEEVSNVARQNSLIAADGGQVMQEVVVTMDGIRNSSARISEIIGTIDSIAFQTNILALNAAVEAARAGEQGRGFAVVAGEVRSLAQRSANAAKEIKALIGASVDKVETGARLVKDAGASMSDIVTSVQQVNDIIGEITAATSEQSEGIGQINAAVTQLDQMTQQNAALVEQSAAAAESMRDQAQRLADKVAAFKLDRH